MNKYTKLFLGFLFDGIGMLSYLFPGIGETTDALWAPASAYLMTRLYKGKEGKVAAIVTFVEEAIPGVDIIPTFTIMWVYTYLIAPRKAKQTTIEVDSE